MSLLNKQHNRQCGFTIVELMIAMVTSLILLGGVLKVYTSSKQSYNMTENLSRLQESARFGTDLLVREIRMAGFIPCRLNGVNTLNLINGAPNTLNFFSNAVTGADSGEADAVFTGLGFPAAGTAAGNRIAGTDAIVLMGGGDKNYTIASDPANPAAALLIVGDAEFEAGDILMVCNDTQATVFQVANASYSGGNNQTTAVHNTGNSVAPSNCENFLFSATAGCDCNDTSCVDNSQKFGVEANIVQLQSHGYFIGAGSDTSVANPTFSLYRVTLENDGAGNLTFTNIQELVTDVENMQILYGVDPDDDNQVERYVTADFVGGGGEPTWNQVISVRLGILARTPDVVSTTNDSTTYQVAGTAIGTATAVSHAADKRLRHAFNSTVKIRNRGI